MPIPQDQAHRALAELQTPRIANLFAQAQAKHVLEEVQELPANFPAFDEALDDKVTFTAYGLLAAACSIAEVGDRQASAPVLERAASLLQYVHGPHTKESRESSFHVLVAAMAFYAASHYSRAFVAIRDAGELTPAARIIGTFLRKDIESLIVRLNEVLLRDVPRMKEQIDLDEWAITVAIARAVATVLEFAYTGADEALGAADGELGDAAVVSATGGHPAWWWVVRLLRLMLKDLGDASLWRVLLPYYGPSPPDALGRYIRLLAFSKRPITELWPSQRAVLPRALNVASPGAIVNLRTSGGKTRVAELAILQTLLADPDARILYLAPFRSLALEVENTLAATFNWLGHRVSHLYGGSRVSSVDTELAVESSITIATPEKAKALFRAVPELLENVKLVIVDEGHLIGNSDREIRNEVFLDHLRVVIGATGARILLLSAVLPNAGDLAQWVTGDRNAVATSTWKPSAERFGVLRWSGSRARVDWHGDFASFNPSFVESHRLGFGRRRKPFPANKNEAVAAAAVRLSAIGPVMIFTGKAVSVPTIARAVLLALGEEPEEYQWPEHEWRVFEALCQEELGQDAIEVRAARAGVVCHSNRLTSQVRLATERLMRSKPPKIIIATTTLAQGVNIGISSVIVATPYIGEETIDRGDFWNICGRAGRAFVDAEGKVLYAIDETRKRWQIRNDERLAQSYFNAEAVEPVESGLLWAIRQLRGIADRAGVSFELLLELVAENNFSELENEAAKCEEICDFVDDELLALHTDPIANPGTSEPEVWAEEVFRGSLAVLQARSAGAEIGEEDVLAFLRTRAGAVLRRVPQRARSAVVSSGLPLSVALPMQENLDAFRAIADLCDADGQQLPQLVTAVGAVEEWARAHAGPLTKAMPTAVRLESLREGWLAGAGLHALASIDVDAPAIARELYGYQLPWIIHAASQQLRAVGELDKADALAKLALLVELGVPTELAARIFLAGIRSRVAATELANLGVPLGENLSEISRTLRTPEVVEQLQVMVSPTTAEWLALMLEDAARQRPQPVPKFAPFSLEGAEGADLLHVREFGDKIYLVTVDGRIRIRVLSTEMLPFGEAANDPRVAFRRSGDVWQMVVRDPRAE